jgi:hypothetical protein
MTPELQKLREQNPELFDAAYRAGINDAFSEQAIDADEWTHKHEDVYYSYGQLIGAAKSTKDAMEIIYEHNITIRAAKQQASTNA